jgi:PAS domain S-box-containing protein
VNRYDTQARLRKTGSESLKGISCMEMKRNHHRFLLLPAALFLVLVVVIAAGAWYYYQLQETHFKAKVQDELSAVANLKMEQIAAWRKERLADAELLSKGGLLTSEMAPNEKIRDRFRRIGPMLKIYKNDFGYYSLIVTDVTGRVIENIGDTTRAPLYVDTAAILKVVAEKKTKIIDFYRCPACGRIHLDVLVPVFAGDSGSAVVGVAVLRRDPEQFLFPLIQTWPVPSRTSETLLLRQEGDSIVYLNELRHRKGTALKLRLPLKNKDLPAAQVARGKEGFMEGKDYRGEKVFSVGRHVPDSPWYIIAKVDKEEVLAPLRAVGITVLIVAGLFAAILCSLLVMWWLAYDRTMLLARHREEMAREQAEEGLRESEEKFRNVFDNSSVGKSITSLEGQVNVNSAFCEMLGYTKEELAHQNWRNLSHPDDSELTQENLGQLQSGEKKSARFIKRYFKKDGSIVWADVGTTLQKDKNGSPLYFITSVIDITERKRAEEAIKTSEERFRTAAENLTDIIYDWDIKEKVDWYGDIDGIMGYSPGEFPRTIDGWAATIHPEDKDRVMAALESHLKNKAPYVIEYRVGRKDGEWRWWSARGTALRDDRDEPYKMIGSISDITERKNAGEALRESEAKYRTLVENIPQKILMKDRNYRWVSINENLARDFGFRPEEVVGKADADLFSPELAAKYHADDVRIMDTGKTEDIEEKYIQEGKETWVNTIKTPVRDASGVIVGVLGIFWDITERKRAGEALERIRVDLARSNKELEQFAYVASHDLQEPLRMVSSYTQLLAQKYEGQLDEKAKKYINYAVDGAVRMQRLINDLLTYSRIGTRGKPSELIDSHSVLGEALRNLAATIEENRAVITNEDLPMVRADESQLMQVFQNLIANAIKFRQKEIPRVHISVREQEHEWVFSVKDNGIGIDPKYSGRLFVIFQRLHTKEEYPGTGIGLAVCKRIVERHGGRIWFESELGKGTTFYFTIPKKE